MIDTKKYVPWDIEVARYNFGANCGPVAYAAALQVEVCDIMVHFPQFCEGRRWTNSIQMRQALAARDITTVTKYREFPRYGLALIQWLGPWTQTDFFARSSLRYTHWVAVDGDWLFDHSETTWLLKDQWASGIAPGYLSELSQAAGWEVKYGLEFRNSIESCRGSSNTWITSRSGEANLLG